MFGRLQEYFRVNWSISKRDHVKPPAKLDRSELPVLLDPAHREIDRIIDQHVIMIPTSGIDMVRLKDDMRKLGGVPEGFSAEAYEFTKQFIAKDSEVYRKKIQPVENPNIVLTHPKNLMYGGSRLTREYLFRNKAIPLGPLKRGGQTVQEMPPGYMKELEKGGDDSPPDSLGAS